MAADGFSKKRAANRRLEFESREISNFSQKGYCAISCAGKENSDESPGSPVLFKKCSTVKKLAQAQSPILMRRKARKKSPILQKRRKKSNSTSEAISPVLISKTVKKSRTKHQRLKTKIKRPPTTSMPTSHTTIPDKKQIGSHSCFNFFVFEGGKQHQLLNVNEDDQQFEIQSCSQSSHLDLMSDLDSDSKTSCFSPENKVSSIFSRAPESLSIASQLLDGSTHLQSKEMEEDFLVESLDFSKKKIRRKQDNLLSRLENIQRKEASEKRICEHKKKIFKVEENATKTVRVVQTWNEGSRFTLKCQQLYDGKAEFLYVFINGKLGSNFKGIGKGSYLRLISPWQEIRLQNLQVSVFLSVTSLEIICDILETTAAKTEMFKIPCSKFKEEESLLFDALLTPDSNAFL